MNQNMPASSDINQTGGAKTNWLSAFNNIFGGASGGNGLFDRLLDEVNHLAALTQNGGGAATPPTPKSEATQAVDAASGAGSKAGLQDVVTALSHFVHQWHDVMQAHNKAPKAATNTASGDHQETAKKDTTQQVQTSQTPATGVTTPVTATPAQTQTADTAGTGTTAPTGGDLNSLIATMQTLLQSLQALQKGASTAGQEATLTIGGQNGLQDAGAMLLSLLKLAQKAAGSLSGAADATPNVAATNAGAGNAGTQTTSATLDPEFLKNLKSLVDQFQAATQNATATTTTPMLPQNNSAALAQNQTPLDNAATTSQNTPLNLMQATLTSADRLMQQLQKAITGQNTAMQADTSSLSGLASAPIFDAPPAINLANAVFTPRAVTADSSNGDAGGGGLMNQGGNNTPTPQATTDVPVTADGLKSTSTYSFASQLSAARGNAPASLPTAVEQVMVQLSRNIKAGNDQMTLQLRPAELGQINIKLNITSDGNVTGTVIASHQATLDLLMKDRSGLERALQDAGLSADSNSLQFSLGGQQGREANNFAQGKQQSNGNSNDSTLAVDVAANGGDEIDHWVMTPGRVNLRV